LVNEVYVRKSLKVRTDQSYKEALDTLIEDIKTSSNEGVIVQPNEKVKVQRWYPGVVEEIVEEVHDKHLRNASCRQRLLSEASHSLLVESTLVSEVYARTSLHIRSDQSPKEALDALIEDIKTSIEGAIAQPNSKVI
jgi:hypothetical protein